MFTTILQGIIPNGGPNFFTDSNGEDYQEGLQQTPEEVAAYFGDQNKVAERTQEGLQEAFARFCGDPYQFSGALVALANAHLGNTGVRFGDYNLELMGDLLVDERTPEAMTAAVQRAIDRYVVEYPVGIDTEEERQEYVNGLTAEERAKYIGAYDRQLEDGARFIVLVMNLGAKINTSTVGVNSSFVALPGLNEAGYPTLAFSDQDIFGTADRALGGRYSAKAGTLVTLYDKAKPGCIPIEGVELNLLDGRAGYMDVSNDDCKPPEDTPDTIPPGDTTPPEDTAPDKDPTDTTPRGGTNDGGSPDPGDPADDGEDGYGTTTSTLATQPTAAPATTGVATSVPQTGTVHTTIASDND